MKKKKAIIVVFTLLLIVGLAGTFWGPAIAEAASGVWNSCPRGLINDPYPGKCRSYIDTNNDAICDRSQADPQSNSSSTTSGSSALAGSSIAQAVAADAAQTAGGQVIFADASAKTEPENPEAISYNRSYYFIPIFAVLVILYGITWILSTRKTITNMLHRKIWNVVLLISAVVSVLLGLFLILSIDFNINISLPFNMLFWHVEAGIALGIIALFHIFWHWRYFAKMIRMT